MGVYIKGMEMPQSCDDCRLKKSYVYAVRSEECAYYCRNVDPYVGMGKRPDWCPIVPVPPHGRLIDEYVLIGNAFNGEQNLYCWDDIEKAIDSTPTIIEAEE